MELKPGYKQTEVGVMPEDWKCVPAGEAIRFFGGNGFSSSAETTTGIRWLKIANVGADKIKWDALSYLPESFLKEYKDYLLKANDVVMALTRPILNNKLKVARLTVEDEPAFLNQRVAKLIPINGNELEYLFYVVQRSNFVAAMNLAMAGTDPPNIGNAALEKIAIAIPPKKEEQTAIANALSDADALIQSLTRLIAKKRQIKQGTMQILLNPYKDGRLKEGWEAKKLGDIGVFTKGSGIRKDEAQSGSLPCIRYGEIYTRHNDYIKKFYSFINGDVAKTAKQLKKGDLLFAGSGETKEEIGKSVAFLSDSVAFAGGDIVILSPISIDSLFFGYYLNTNPINKQKASKGQGDAVVHINATALVNIEIIVPSNSIEQTRIATILSDMDTEIAVLEAKLAKYRHIKQGMMQNLLTGRIRLVKPESNTGAVA